MPLLKPAIPVNPDELSKLTPSERLEKDTEAILAHRPDLALALGKVSEVIAGPTSTLPRRVAELTRLRIAFFNQCRACMSLRYAPTEVTEGLICSLERPAESPDLSAAEKVAIRFAELMATDHLAIDESLFNQLRQHYSEQQIVQLSVACALHVGFGRMGATWRLHEHLPERFKIEQDAPFTPWSRGGVVASSPASA